MISRPHSRSGNTVLKILLPLAFLGVTALFTILILSFVGEPEKKEVTKIVPNVEVMSIEEQPLQLTVVSQGTVQARTETALIAEVSGVVEFVSSKLFAGSFFKKGDLLLTIDKIEYEAALANAKGMLASAKLAYAQEEALSAQAMLDWKEMGRGEPNDLVLRKPQLEKAAADREAAEAAVALAERNLSKTEVIAPYDGRVKSKFVDIGQIVNARMTQLALVYSVDVAEVRLPISAKDAGRIDLPEVYRDGKSDVPLSSVTLSSEIGGELWSWEGVIDRTEGVINPTTRQLFLIAKVEDPYARKDQPNRPPLKVGQFVTAEIQGKTLGNGFVIPRSTLKPGNVVHMVDVFDRLQITPVTVVQAGVEEVFVSEGLSTGDRISLTQLGIVVDGMDVLVEEKEPLP
jgi:RND family efflux transporter MFP subunit